MLKRITRDDQKGPKVPHQNKVKNTNHHYEIGSLDFPDHRSTSTKQLFHDEKRPALSDYKKPQGNQSHFELSHGHRNLGLESTMTRHDYGPYRFSDHVNSVEGRKYSAYRSGLSAPKQTSVYVYPSMKKISNSLSIRDPSEVLVADRSEAFMSRKDLLKSKFELSNDKEFRKKSHYGESYVDVHEGGYNLPPISMKSSTRTYDIINGFNKKDSIGDCGMNHYRYENYNPNVNQRRESSNKSRMNVVLNRIDPITGRCI